MPSIRTHVDVRNVRPEDGGGGGGGGGKGGGGKAGGDDLDELADKVRSPYTRKNKNKVRSPYLADKVT